MAIYFKSNSILKAKYHKVFNINTVKILYKYCWLNLNNFKWKGNDLSSNVHDLLKATALMVK